MILTESSEQAEIFAVPVAAAQQWGVSELFGPLTVAEIPVFVGDAKPQGLVKTVAVTVCPWVSVLVRIFNVIPVMTAPAGITTLFLGNREEDVPRPTQSLLPMDWSEAR